MLLGRSLLMKASGARLLYPGYVQVLLDRITAADVGAGNTQGLEVGVTDAISTCVQALVADGILGVSGGVLSQAASLIKASCFMMGPRTLPGALVPLAADMPAPTNVNFTSGDYNRRTGLGDPTNVSKYLNSNRLVNSDGLNNCHLSACVTQADTRNQANTYAGLIGCQRDSPPYDNQALFYMGDGTLFAQSRGGAATPVFPTRATTGFAGVSRASSTQNTVRGAGVSTVTNSMSTTSQNNNVFVFNLALGAFPSGSNYTNARLNFYSIGSALDLAILDARITALSNVIQAAIAP